MIADDEKVLALAGVVGGKTSGVTEKTTNIVVEIAHFDPVAVRKTGTRLGLRTDAELRYEKHINPLFSLYSLLFFLEESKFYATDLGNNAVHGISYHIADTLKSSLSQKKTVEIDAAKGASIIFGNNTHAFDDSATKILENLGFAYSENTVTIPLRRSPDDMNIPEDIYEEVARIHGYDNIEPQPLQGESAYVPFTPEVKLQRAVEDYLIHEARMEQGETYPWAEESHYAYFGHDKNTHYTLLNPSSPETSKLRPDMIYGLMDIVEKNHRTFDEIRVFDTGKIWPEDKGKLTERKALGMALYRKSISGRQQDTILELKAHVQTLLHKL